VLAADLLERMAHDSLAVACTAAAGMVAMLYTPIAPPLITMAAVDTGSPSTYPT